MAEKIFLEIDAKTAQAAKDLTKFGRTATKTMEGVQKSLNGVKLLAGGVVGFLAGRQIVRGLEKITQAAAVQEDAINELNTALRLSGKFSEDASVGLQKFASDLQNASTFGDEAILSNAALIQSLGNLETEGLKRATKAAADLSAALGIDLRSASQLVGKAAAGEVGSFSRYGLVIKKAEDNATTFANALDALEAKFSGAALSKINTYSGAMQQLDNVQGDLLEELGFLITRNPIVIDGVKRLTGFFGELIKVVQDNQKGISELVSKGFKAVISAVPALLKSVQFVIDAYNGIKLAIDLALQSLIEIALFAAKAANLASWNPLEALQEAITGEELPNKTRDLVRELEILKKASQDSFGDNIGPTAFSKTLDESIKKAQGLSDAINKIPDKTVNVNFNTQVNGTSKAVSEVKKDIEGLINLNFGMEGPGTADMTAPGPKPEGPAEPSWVDKYVYGAGDQIAENFYAKIKDMKVGDMIGAGLSAMLSGKQGAVSAVSAFADVLLPGIGGAVTQLANLGPEGAKAMIKEFATSLPDIVVTVVEALAASADVIVESLIDSLLIKGGLERIVVSLISATPRIAYKLVESTIRGLNNGIVALSERFGLGITRAMKIPQWVEDLRRYIRGLTKTPEWMAKFQFEMPNWMTRLEEIFNWLPNAIKRAVTPSIGGDSVSGGAKSAAGSIPIIGQYMAKGGMVYAADGFVPRGTDTVPAMLTPGERVLSVSQNQSFEAMPVLLAQILQVLGQPMLTNTTIEIDGNRLADVILQLNRQNQRLTA